MDETSQEPPKDAEPYESDGREPVNGYLAASPPRDLTRQNTDTELWADHSDPRDEDEGVLHPAYAPRMHVTADGLVGMNVGGRVFVRRLRDWHALAAAELDDTKAGPDEARTVGTSDRTSDRHERVELLRILAGGGIPHREWPVAFAAALELVDGPVPTATAADALFVARHFHEAYEELAPDFGYETRRESRVPWENVPDNNRRLMTAVAARLYASGVIR